MVFLRIRENTNKASDYLLLFSSWWQHAGNLASYEQQDAHEFFISMLDGIHEKVDKDERKPHNQGELSFDLLLLLSFVELSTMYAGHIIQISVH